MATPSDSEGLSVARDVRAPSAQDSDLLQEILSAEADFERGDYIDLTREQLERCILTGESPWPDESLA